ncbi:hypothetical protein QQS21_007930 [Conoideocrella luteorostrata]|uniref:Uncharacterized protein n=1 Tax=Conoideocrella luteorostrata TaxID=1105319 RepID=A0AAJ0CK65_9HYPO|nr:hypothetical protein QQS21_007930 [Conoideocrella luteorostrata]
MEQQSEQQEDFQDDPTPLSDVTKVIHLRLDRAARAGSKRLTRRAVFERDWLFGRPDHAPVISSPLRQPSWDQSAVPASTTPHAASLEYDDRPLLSRGLDDEPVVLHPPGLERVSPEIWANWYLDDLQSNAAGPETEPDEEQQPSLRELSEAADPDYSSSAYPLSILQDPVGSARVSRSGGPSSSQDPMSSNFSTPDLPRPPSGYPFSAPTPSRSRGHSKTPLATELYHSQGASIVRPGTPRQRTSSSRSEGISAEGSVQPFSYDVK